MKPIAAQGSVTTSTHRTDELIPAFCNMLEHLLDEWRRTVKVTDRVEATEYQRTRSNLERISKMTRRGRVYYTDNMERALRDLTWLKDTLGLFTDSRTIFGLRGNDYGYWAVESEINT